MICIMSVQHTGTWFVIRLLERLLNRKCIVSEQMYISKNVRPQLAHFHIGAPVGGLPKSKVYEVATQPDFILEALAKCHKVVVPVRDPIRSLITRQNRHSDLSHIHIVNGFKYLTTGALGDVFYLPIDLPLSGYGRMRLLRRMCRFLEIPLTEGVRIILREYVVDWGKQNSTEDSGYHFQYDYGNIEYLKSEMHYELGQLFECTEIRDLLVQIGYTDLPWYSEVE